MDRSDSLIQPDPRVDQTVDPNAAPDDNGISPLNPATFPRAEDDNETLAHSPEFHDLPDPGPNVGRDAPRR
jgi:hypothetical protein